MYSILLQFFVKKIFTWLSIINEASMKSWRVLGKLDGAGGCRPKKNLGMNHHHFPADAVIRKI